ncbi:SDR family NAD(P)-dependent oxidoreductase [Candidatus Nitrospira nitrificans]|uniref:3-oxoacyl-(Acyl-carrier-protein) reductase n=1 Tax=Candidatus Nitrospira nitrificans TaxID=1742973 RepID=A0A0S4LMS0_9BACT|nr:SDR family NAD(P)-dependent oxidoreductase [Candidatus Nitrospira nitrificans]CUS38042.1 3-oxoacyl-(Acyl-carrier-protein) reductase [Candidatus Nitrospira nitrificans]
MEPPIPPIPPAKDRSTNQSDRPAVLITGASGGIGRAISHAFGKIGWYVGVHYYRNKPAAEATLNHVLKDGGSGAPYSADIREAESVRRMVDRFSCCTSGPLALVCNAGIGQSELLARHADEIWDNVIATNLTGTFHCLRAMAPTLLARGGGSIIVLGSHTGFHGATGQSAYATSKAGLIGLVRTAALEWGPKNIRVNLVLPGWQKTGLTEGLFPEGQGWLDHALHRPAALDEVVGTIVHLTQLKDISGQVWNCDSRNL